jgi:hypothetical protein
MLAKILQTLGLFKNKQVQSDSFLIQCRQNTFDNIYPADESVKSTDGYKTLKDISENYFKNNKQDEFANYLMEGQYFVQLWAAHMLLEYGSPSKYLTTKCLDEIKKYSNSTLNSEVAAQETLWLKNFS